MAAPIEADLRAEQGLRTSRAGRAILVAGVILTVVATAIAFREAEREEHMLWQADTAPIRSAVEREITKYSALQTVAQLATDPLAGDAGDGVKTQLLGETLERLYPAVNFVAFVRSVGKDDAGDYMRRRGIKAPRQAGAGGGAGSAAPTSADEPAARHYFLESFSPTSPRGFKAGTDLGAIPAFAANLDRAARMNSLLVTRERAEAGRTLPDALVILGIDRPSASTSTGGAARKGTETKPREHSLHQFAASVIKPAGAKRDNPRQLLQEPFGFLIVGIDMSRLMNDAMLELPHSWHVRLTALSAPDEEPPAAGASQEGRLLFDSHLEMAPGMEFPPVRPALRMDPFRFEAWGTRLLLDMEGHEQASYQYVDLMPWLTFVAGLLLTAGVFFGHRRFRNARTRVQALTHEVRTSTERFRDMVETSSDWIWELDARFRFTYLSPTTETLLDYTPAELLGESAIGLLPDAADADVPAHLFPVGKSGQIESYTGFERRLRRKNGAEIIVESAGTPITGAQGEVVGYRGIDRDVTQQREFRQRLSQLHEDLARHMQSNLAGQLLSGLAHELNQPLAAILTYNQACLRLMKSGNADPAEIAAAMQSTADNVVHARDILQRLRRFTARREPHAVPMQLEPLVKSALALIEIRLRSLSIETRINIFSTTPAVLVDPILATQVLLNVFNNAIDAMSESDVRRIDVRAHVLRGRTVQVRIADSGPGIAPEDLPRLFDAYFTTKPEGTGIGLPLCRSIIEAMGGAIKVSSTPGKGAVVELEFPVARRN